MENTFTQEPHNLVRDDDQLSYVNELQPTSNDANKYDGFVDLAKAYELVCPRCLLDSFKALNEFAQPSVDPPHQEELQKQARRNTDQHANGLQRDEVPQVHQ